MSEGNGSDVASDGPVVDDSFASPTEIADYVRRLTIFACSKYGNPDWHPLDDTLGQLTQLDNALTGLSLQPQATEPTQPLPDAAAPFSRAVRAFDAESNRQMMMGEAEDTGRALREALNVLSTPQPDPLFGEVDGLIDEQLYEYKLKADFDPHDDDEWCVSLTAKQWRAVERALAIANGMVP